MGLGWYILGLIDIIDTTFKQFGWCGLQIAKQAAIEDMK